METFLRQLVTIEFEDKKDTFTGFLIDYSDNWILLKNNPVDFILDGFVILRNKRIKTVYRVPDYEFIEKVIRLKKSKTTTDAIVPLKDLITILNFISDKYGLFQIATKSDKAVYIGKVHEYNDDELVIDFVNTKAKWDGKKYFTPKKIRVIEFDTDYINSLQLVLESESK